jgi:5'-3' exonuclease
MEGERIKREENRKDIQKERYKSTQKEITEVRESEQTFKQETITPCCSFLRPVEYANKSGP